MSDIHKANYLDEKSEIDALVLKIKKNISLCNPLDLMNCSYLHTFMTHVNKFSELDYTSDENMIGRTTEYIQSVLVSSENHFKQGLNDQNVLFNTILADIKELYEKIMHSWFFSSCNKYLIKSNPDIAADINVLQFIVEMQLVSFVRGYRYQFLQLEHLRNLLPSHNPVLRALFDMSAEDIISGLEKLQYSLGQARLDAKNSLNELYDGYVKAIAQDENKEAYISRIHCDALPVFEKVIGISRNNVTSVTGWNDKFINALSLSLNEDNSFFSDKEFSGWPLLELPVHKKPFIKIENISYCFEYYSLFDHIYRIIQKTIKELKPDYEDKWAKLQQDASETMVENIFKKLLPGCITYRSNYYPRKERQKNWVENDLIVLYDNTLIIAEVKAGSYTHIPAVLDYRSHIDSLKNLIEKADHQCDRTLQYINSEKEVAIYSKDKKLKGHIKNADYTYIYTFSVTVDNFNESATKAEKLTFLKLKSNSISLSVDDLMVYAEYFTSPLYFLHFLEQRKLAIQTPKIALSDELDHLGLYIEHNVYSLKAKSLSQYDKVTFTGYRYKLDNYFNRLCDSSLDSKKPQQPIPKMIKNIVDFLDTAKIPNRSYLSNFLLNMHSEARNEFSTYLEKSLVHQKEKKCMMPVSAFGDVRYCVFIHQSDIAQMNFSEKKTYVYSKILKNKEKNRVWLDLFFDVGDNLFNINFYVCKPEDVENDKDKLLSCDETSNIINSCHKQTRKKIAPNKPCPCGSGKKYKKCCRRL
jgi:hypothetical protein